MLRTSVIKTAEAIKRYLEGNVEGLVCVLDAPYLYITGNLWNIRGLTREDNCYIYIDDSVAYIVRVDVDNRFLCLSQSTQSTGVEVSDYTETCFATLFYAETEDGIPISNLQNLYAKVDFSGHPFFLENTRVANISQCFDLCVANNNILISFDYETEYKLIPMFIGSAKMRKLYVCPNAVAVIGTVITDSVHKYKCIGTRIWYEVA